MSTVFRARTAKATASKPNRLPGITKTLASVLAFGAAICGLQPARAQYVQQGPKLVGINIIGSTGALQGTSMALSADGNTLLVGGNYDNNYTGAAWVFTRQPCQIVCAQGLWTQQGKLVASDSSGVSQVGYSAALSADGNTAIIGGPYDNGTTGPGAAWVFTRSNGVWTQQGSKLVGSGFVDPQTFSAQEGWSVGISGDGNTAIIGAPYDDYNNTGNGAAWIFTRSGGVWAQQGSKLVGTGGAAGGAQQGYSVALSGDGQTALVGGPYDNSTAGASWVFTVAAGTWTQQGQKLVGNDPTESGQQGLSVALSSDGNTALIGAPGDGQDGSTSGAWAFTRSAGTWTQQGSELAPGVMFTGSSVALSGSGNIAALGSPGTPPGQVYIFANTSGAWTQVGSPLVGSGDAAQDPEADEQGVSVTLSADGKTAAWGDPHCCGAATDTGATWVFSAPGAGAFTASPSSGTAPLAVRFTATDLSPPLTYTINFGDGTTGALTQNRCLSMPPLGGQLGAQCSGFASHTYTSGSYTATFTNASGITLGSVAIKAGGLPVVHVSPIQIKPVQIKPIYVNPMHH